MRYKKERCTCIWGSYFMISTCEITKKEQRSCMNENLVPLELPFGYICDRNDCNM